MNFLELAKKRRSIRSYDPERKIPDDIVMNILEAGRIAPCAANLQPWTFYFISDRSMLDRICESYSREWIKNAPHILIVTGNSKESWTRVKDKRNSVEVDLTIATDHIVLAAEEYGIGTCWLMAFDEDIVRDALGLGENHFISCMIPMGYTPKGYEKREMPVKKSPDKIYKFI